MNNGQEQKTENAGMISIGDFAKLEIKIGLIVSAEKAEGSDKLIRFLIDVGPKPEVRGASGSADHSTEPNNEGEERDIRQILSGIAEHYPDPGILVGKRVPVLVNLAPRIIRGHKSEGMVLYAVGNGTLTTLEPADDVLPGTPIR